MDKPALAAMVRKSTLIAALMIVLPGMAQNLTKGQEGRKVVGQCYSACMVASTEYDKMTVAQTRRMYDLLRSDYWLDVSEDQRDADWWSEQLTSCLLETEAFRIMDVCRAGCMDVEAAYGVRSSLARTRFMNVYNGVMKRLKDAGLWVAFNRTPTDFRQSCLRLWGEGGSGAETVERLSASRDDARPPAQE